MKLTLSSHDNEIKGIYLDGKLATYFAPGDDLYFTFKNLAARLGMEFDTIHLPTDDGEPPTKLN
jgi:hypothetical protein